MFRSRGENLRSIYILLFLNIAFFLLQHQDGEKFARLFSFDGHAVANGEVWRLFTYQFVQAGQVGLLPIPPVLTLFLNLVLLTLMGLAVEEEWGTFHFLKFYLLSTLSTAAVAAFFHTPLLGSFFINFTLLFVYASIYREQTFYLFVALPIRVTLLAWLAFAALLVGVRLTTVFAADWTYEEKANAKGSQIYAAKTGTSVGFECGPNTEPSLWVMVNLV